MKRIFSALRRFSAQDTAATMVEYAIMVGLIAIVCFAAVQLVGSSVNTKFSALANTFT